MSKSKNSLEMRLNTTYLLQKNLQVVCFMAISLNFVFNDSFLQNQNIRFLRCGSKQAGEKQNY